MDAGCDDNRRRPLIVVVDYRMGNLRSMRTSLERAGAGVRIVTGPEGLEGADGLVLPGVGAFGPAMANLTEQRLLDPVIAWAQADRPFLAICVGMQLLLEESEEGSVFVSVNDRDKRAIIPIARQLADQGLDIVSTAGTAIVLARNGIPAKTLARISEGRRPHVVDMMKNGELGMLVNTVSGRNPRRDEILIRSEAIARGIPVISTVAGAQAAADGIASLRQGAPDVRPLQEYARAAVTSASSTRLSSSQAVEPSGS